MKLNIFFVCFLDTQYLFSCWNKWDSILLPFLFSVASNGTCGFSTFSSCEKEFLQMQCQTALDQWSEQNSWKSHLTHYPFLCVGTVIWWTQRNTFWILFLKTGNLASVRWVEISSSLISRSTFEENQGKSLFSPKVSNLWQPGSNRSDSGHTFLLESLG